MTDLYSAGLMESSSSLPEAEAEAGSRNSKKPRGKIRAKANWFYTRRDVMELFAVSRNTVGNWCRDGLPFLDAGGERLFLGQDLNAFNPQRRKRPSRPGEWHEIYCVCCKGWHSLLQVPIEGVVDRRHHKRITITCPERGGHASGLVSEADWDRLRQSLESGFSSRSHD